MLRVENLKKILFAKYKLQFIYKEVYLIMKYKYKTIFLLKYYLQSLKLKLVVQSTYSFIS